MGPVKLSAFSEIRTMLVLGSSKGTEVVTCKWDKDLNVGLCHSEFGTQPYDTTYNK